MHNNQMVEFELAPAALGYPVSVRLSDFDARWLAVVECRSVSTEGLGGNARDALLAALSPLGTRATVALMADPAMFGASATLIATRRGRASSAAALEQALDRFERKGNLVSAERARRRLAEVMDATPS
jgi:hypothetical protein